MLKTANRVLGDERSVRQHKTQIDLNITESIEKHLPGRSRWWTVSQLSTVCFFSTSKVTEHLKHRSRALCGIGIGPGF